MLEIKHTPRSDAVREWEDRLRPLLRYAILCGDVSIKGNSYDTPHANGSRGLDTDRRLAYVDLVRALRALEIANPMGRELVRRSIGIHCDNERCPLGPGHWHSASWLDLVSGAQPKEALQAQLEDALVFIMDACR